MHEISLCEGILQILEDQAQAQHFSTVKRIRLEIGRLSCVEIEALHFAFDVVMKGSLAENAALEIIRVPGEAYCFDCGKRVQINDRLEPCPDCGGVTLSPTGGDDMRIKNLEVV